MTSVLLIEQWQGCDPIDDVRVDVEHVAHGHCLAAVGEAELDVMIIGPGPTGSIDENQQSSRGATSSISTVHHPLELGGVRSAGIFS